MTNDARAKNKPVSQPFLGLFLDRPAWQVDPAGLIDCNNVRIINGRITSFNMGWTLFLPAGTRLNGAVTLIDLFQFSNGTQTLILGTPTDLYNYNNGVPLYITPSYTSGTVAVSSSGAVTGTNTQFNSTIGQASFTASVAIVTGVGVLTVTGSVTGYPLAVGMIIAGAGVPVGTLITGYGTGGGGAGTYFLSNAFTQASETMTVTPPAIYRKNVRPGDMFYIGSATQNMTAPTGANGGWWTVQSVASDTSLQLTNYTGGVAVGGTAYTARQLFAGDAQAHHWNSENFPIAGFPDNGDLWFATNGTDCLFKWNGSTTFGVFVTTMPFISYQLRRWKNMMIYGGLVLTSGVFAPSSIANSDNNLPISMITGIASQFVVTDDTLTINDLEVLGNSLMIYCGNVLGGDVISAQFIGFPLIFTFTEVVRRRGPIASRLVATFPDRHQFIGIDGEYRYNGLFIQLMNTQVWRVVLQAFDLSRSERAWSLVNKQFGEIIWAIPLTSDTNNPGINTAYTEHYLEQAQNFLFKPIMKRDMPMTTGGFFPQASTLTWDKLVNPFNTYQIPFNSSSISGSYPLCLVGDANGLVYTLFNGDTQNGTGFASFAAFPQRILVNERSRGLLKRIYPLIEVVLGATYKITVTANLYDQVGGAIAIQDIQLFDPSYSGNRFTTHYRRGRVGNVIFSTPGPSMPWTLDGYDADVVPGGLR